MDAGPRRALLYARSVHGAASTAVQLGELRRAAMGMGWLVAGEFVDAAAASRRAERERLLDQVRRGVVGGGVVVCTSLSAIAGSTREAVGILADLLSRGVDVVAVADGLDTTLDGAGTCGRLIDALAAVEMDARRERGKRAISEARRAGQRVGRPRVKVAVEQAMRLIEEGAGLRQAARVLGIAPSTLHRALRPASPPAAAAPAA